jgi:hypothetical protein
MTRSVDRHTTWPSCGGYGPEVLTIGLVSGPGWDNDAWQQIRDYERFWAPFDAHFRFRAGTRAEAWPAINEPAGSVTFDLSPFFERGHGVDADAAALNEQVLRQ